jgi:hypothetical protein
MRIQKRIKSIIEKQGENVTYKHQNQVTRNTSTLKNTITYTDYTIKAHIRLYTPKEIAGLVSEGDREMRIAADSLPVVPKNNSRVVVNSQLYNIISVDRRTAYGEDALYILQIRGEE